MSRELGDLLEQTARGPCDPTFDPADLAAKARAQRRLGAVAAVVVVLAGLVGGAAWVRSAAMSPQAPFVGSGPPESAPQGWQTVQIGEAALSVPPDWKVHTGRAWRLPCDPFEEPAIWLGHQPAPTCPAPAPSPQHVGVIAIPMPMIDEQPVGDHDIIVNDHAGRWRSLDDGNRLYWFPSLDVQLTIAYRPNPQLAERILSTLQRASRGPASDGEAALDDANTVELLGKWDSGPPAGPAHLSVAWTDDTGELARLWGTFRLEDLQPPIVVEGDTILLVATGESGSCPAQVTGTTLDRGRIKLELTEGPDIFPVPSDYGCTADFNPVTFAFRIETEIVEPGMVVSIGETALQLGQEGELVTAQYGERPTPE